MFTLFVIALIGTFVGAFAGGSGLITLPAMMIAGIPVHTGIAANKFSSGIASFSGMWRFYRQGKLAIGALFSSFWPSFVGGIVGALFISHIAAQTMNTIAIVLLCFALLINIKQTNVAMAPPKPFRPWLPFCIAAYDGGFGPGSATFTILYALGRGRSYEEAVIFSRISNFASCLGAFLIFYNGAFFSWATSLAIAAGSIVGTQLGLACVPYVSLRLARQLVTIVIIGLISYLTFLH